MEGAPSSESPREKLRKALGVGRDASDADFRAAFEAQDSDGQAELEQDMEDVLGDNKEGPTVN